MSSAQQVTARQQRAGFADTTRQLAWAVKGASAHRTILLWLGVLVIACLHMIPFTYGYRMSADDTAFTQQFMGSVADIMQSGAMDAHLNGRIGMFVLRPLNIAAAYLSGNPVARAAFVALYFLNFLLFSILVSRLLRRDVTRLLFLILVVGHPLAFEHMPPNAYALQNTLPFLLILASRIRLASVRQAGPGHWRRLEEIALLVLFGVCLCLSEYATIFGTALLLTEYSARLLHDHDAAAGLVQGVVRIARRRDFRTDSLVAVTAVAAYGVFRWFNPSHYDGNSPDGIFEFARLGTTIAGHIWSGTTLGQLVANPLAIGWVPLLASVAIGAMTAICAYSLLPAIGGMRMGWGWLAVAALAAIYVTFPLAMTLKQQSWCVDSGACGFLDSRSSYFWIGLGILFAAALLLAKFQTGRSHRRALVLASVGLGLLSMLTYAHNRGQAERMQSISLAWKRADLLACMPGRAPRSDDELKGLIDPRGQVLFHPDVWQQGYWRRYVTQMAAYADCPPDAQSLRRAYGFYIGGMRPLDAGRKLKLSRATGLAYLGSGWSPERWGAWSVGQRAEVRFGLDGAGTDVLVSFHALKHQAGRATKPVIVEFNGQPMASLSMRDSPMSYSVRIPASLLNRSAGGGNVLAFLVPDSISPRQAGSGEDMRQLGIGLVEMTVEHVNSSGRVPPAH